MKYLIIFLVASQAILQFSDAAISFNKVKGFIKSGKVEEIVRVVREGFNVNMVGNCKKSLLMWAALSGAPQIARILLENGANANYQERGTGMTALMYATSKNKVDVARVMMDFNVDKNMRDNNGRTAMDHAKRNNYYNNMAELF